MPQCQEEIKGPFANGLSRVVMYDGGVWDMQNSATRPVTHAEMVMYPTVIGLRAAVGGSAAKSDWLGALGPADGPPGGIWIGFIRRTIELEQSIVAVTVTGSLKFPTIASLRETNRFYRNSTLRDCDEAAWSLLLLCRTDSVAMDAAGFSVIENRAGVTFGVELYVPWDAPEMATDMSAKGTVPLRNVQDVFGMRGRRKGATESHILQGRDARSIRVLVPDCRCLENNFHDVTVVDMGELPESEITIHELSDLTRKWPPELIAHMRWRQPELEEMQQAAKLQYIKKQPAQCDFCSRTIRCDMYRHVARCHLKLAQLWRCPVAWCTVWKGVLQDITDHVRYAHRVPEAVIDIKIEKIIPPWTESLNPRHSGISNDILLFSDIGLSLSHHYRVHKKGVPHVAFRKNYMPQLRAMLPLPAAPLAKSVSLELDRSGLEESPEAVGSFQRPSRWAFARRRIPRVREIPTRIAPRLKELDPLAEAGA